MLRMHDKRFFLSVCLLVLAMSSALAESCNTLDALQDFLGTWQSEGEKTQTTESWVSVSPSSYEGQSLTRYKSNNTLKDGETLRLLEMSGEVFYLAKVTHNALPVAFKLTVCSAGRFVFENRQHDFPKQLEYVLTGKDELLIKVSDGQKKGFELRFQKQKTP